MLERSVSLKWPLNCSTLHSFHFAILGKEQHWLPGGNWLLMKPSPSVNFFTQANDTALIQVSWWGDGGLPQCTALILPEVEMYCNILLRSIDATATETLQRRVIRYLLHPWGRHRYIFLPAEIRISQSLSEWRKPVMFLYGTGPFPQGIPSPEHLQEVLQQYARCWSPAPCAQVLHSLFAGEMNCTGSANKGA